VFVSIGGGILVLNGSIKLGDVQAFIQYSQQLTQPMSQAAGIANMIQTALASAERIFTLLDEEEEQKETELAVNLDEFNGDIPFDHVRFGYNANEPIIKDFTLDVKSGQTIAIVGPTGAGKATIINLLKRFYEINVRSISIDGTPINELTREQVRSLFAMVMQDTWLFKGSIRDNIAYGRKDVSEAEIIEAAKNAFADDFIRTMPDGYDTILGEDAANI